MRYSVITVLLSVVLSSLTAGATAPEEAVPLGKITAVLGTVQIGRDGQWRAPTIGDPVFEGEGLKTGLQSAVEILFDEEIKAKVGEDTQIEISDLLLKTRLENMKSRISAPTDTRKVEMQVTPLTGVRGTDQTEEKSEDLKREHYWNENVTPTQ